MNPKTSLSWEDDVHRGCYASCFSSHRSTGCVFSDGPNTCFSPITLASVSGQVCALCVYQRVKLYVKFERKTARKKIFEEYKIKHDSCSKLKEA